MRPYLIDSSVYAPTDHKFAKFYENMKKKFHAIDSFFVPADDACHTHSVNAEAFH